MENLPPSEIECKYLTTSQNKQIILNIGYHQTVTSLFWIVMDGRLDDGLLGDEK